MRVHRPPVLRLLPLLALPLVLAACGGGDDDGGASTASTGAQVTSTGAAPATTSSTATTAGKADPAARLKDVAAAIRKVRSYHIEGDQTDDDGRAEIDGDVSATGDAEITYRLKGGEFEFRILGAEAYLRGNAAYWKSAGGAQGGALAEKLADRWVKSPASASADTAELIDQLRPSTLASCVDVGLGTLSDGGRATVGGTATDVIADAGDRPGTTPGKLFIAASGPPLPLRVLQTGKRTPGGKIDPKCQDEDDTSTASDLRLSRFDEPVDIETPKGAIELPDDGSGGAPAPSQS